MADTESSNNSGIVAIFAIVMLMVIGAFIAWQAGVFSGGKRGVDVDVNVPGQTSK